jgi:hypothetical protein
MASMIPVQGLFSKLLHFAGIKINFFFNRGSFQNEGQLQGLKHYLSQNKIKTRRHYQKSKHKETQKRRQNQRLQRFPHFFNRTNGYNDSLTSSIDSIPSSICSFFFFPIDSYCSIANHSFH